jgi:hypothetical protein
MFIDRDAVLWDLSDDFWQAMAEEEFMRTGGRCDDDGVDFFMMYCGM